LVTNRQNQAIQNNSGIVFRCATLALATQFLATRGNSSGHV